MQPKDQMSHLSQNDYIVNDAPMQNEAPKQKNKYLPWVIVLAIAAVAGLGFGIYEFWQNSQKDKKITSLEYEKEQNEQTINEMTKSIETMSEFAQEVQNDETSDDGTERNNANRDQFDITIASQGKICAVNVTQNKIMACAEDVEGIKEFYSCDSSSDILSCVVATSENTVKFVYNITDGSFTHGQLMKK